MKSGDWIKTIPKGAVFFIYFLWYCWLRTTEEKRQTAELNDSGKISPVHIQGFCLFLRGGNTEMI